MLAWVPRQAKQGPSRTAGSPGAGGGPRTLPACLSTAPDEPPARCPRSLRWLAPATLLRGRPAGRLAGAACCRCGGCSAAGPTSRAKRRMASRAARSSACAAASCGAPASSTSPSEACSLPAGASQAPAAPAASRRHTAESWAGGSFTRPLRTTTRSAPSRIAACSKRRQPQGRRALSNCPVRRSQPREPRPGTQSSAVNRWH